MARKRRQSRNSTTARSWKKKQQPFSCFPSAKTARCPKPIQQHSRKSYSFTRDLSQKPACSSPTKPQLLNKPKTSSPPERRIRNRTAFAAAAKSSPEPASSTAEPYTLKLTTDSVFAAGVDDVFRPSPFRSINDEQNGIVLERPKPKLRPIVTKQVRAKPASSSQAAYPYQNDTVPRNLRNIRPNCSPRDSGGVRLRQRSPQILGRRSFHGDRKVASSRRSLSDSFAIRKTSMDPFRDFKDSMMEMTVQNNIKASKDFEELLARYLCLNSGEYHHVIIEAFKQIWTDLSDSQFPAKNFFLKQV